MFHRWKPSISTIISPLITACDWLNHTSERNSGVLLCNSNGAALLFSRHLLGLHWALFPLWGVSSVGSSPLFTRQQRMWHRFPEHNVLGKLNPHPPLYVLPVLCGLSPDPNKSSLCAGAEQEGEAHQDLAPVVQMQIQCQCRAAVKLSVQQGIKIKMCLLQRKHCQSFREELRKATGWLKILCLEKRKWDRTLITKYKLSDDWSKYSSHLHKSLNSSLDVLQFLLLNSDKW